MLQKNAIIYARVSTGRQADKGLSLPGQIERCRQAAADRGYHVVRVFQEAESGFEDARRRPEFQSAVSFAMDAGNQVAAFVVYDTSRFARRREDAAIYKRVLREAGVEILYAESKVDPHNEDDLFLEGLHELLDERYSRVLRRLALRGMVDAAKRGFVNGGGLPFGFQWKRIKDGPATRLSYSPHPRQAHAVRRIFQMVLDGMGGVEISRALNADGVEGPRAGQCWKASNVNYILNNPRYKGTLSFKAPPPEGEIVVERAFEGLVSPETWDEVRKLLEARRPYDRATLRTNPKRTVALSGVLFCGGCGGAMVATTARGGGGKTYHYYECSRGRKGEATCEGLRLPAYALDDAVLGYLEERVFTAENVDRIWGTLLDFAEGHNEEQEQLRRRLEAERADCEMRIGRILETLETSREFDPADLAPRIAQLRQTKRTIEADLEKIELMPIPYDGESCCADLLSYLRGTLEDLVHSDEDEARKNVENLAVFLRKIGLRITVKPASELEISIHPALAAGGVFIERKIWRA